MSTTRREISKRKTALLCDLRSSYQSGGAGVPGEMALSQRELSARYGLSMRTVGLALQNLVEEGVLYTIPRVGTFVGRPQNTCDKLFLALFRYLDSPNIQWSAFIAGFEEHIANLGGSSLVLDFETAKRYQASGEIGAAAGVFEMHDSSTSPIWREAGTARVEFGELHNVNAGCDAVYFDNPGGGWKATRHLLGLGHRKIAFLALHSEQEDPDFFLWSQEREAGWRRALEEAGHSTQGLAFHPLHTPSVDIDELKAVAADVAAGVMQRDDVTAVVAVNAYACEGFFRALRSENCPISRWPAIVGFDTEITQLSQGAMTMVTTLRLPWEEIGREAANLLWERAHGRSHGLVQKLVPMTLIPRLSCRQKWQQASNISAQAAALA